MSIKVGDTVKGTITGIRPYGAFVTLQNGYKGLIHISEISERFVKDVSLFVHIHERVKVKVLEIDDGEHIKLSLKAVSSNKDRFHLMHRMHRQALPKSVIGFSSLADHLDMWMEQANARIQEEAK